MLNSINSLRLKKLIIIFLTLLIGYAIMFIVIIGVNSLFDYIRDFKPPVKIVFNYYEK